MEIILSQMDIAGAVIWFILFFVLIFMYPRLMLSQLLFKLEQSAARMEKMTSVAINMSAKKANKNPGNTLKNKIKEFTDFFVVEPSSLDPYGIVKKIDVTIRGMENRFGQFTNEISESSDYDSQQGLNYGLRATIGLRQISKIVRHYVEIAKKFKNLQIAMVLQMQLPIIEKIAESELKGTEAFVNGWPIGDSIGPLAAASMIESGKETAEDIMMGTTTIEGRKCFVLKARGPAPHLGRIDEAIEKVMKKNRISRVITIDAAQKLEGEKSGSVAEGVGFAMGGWAQREIIENTLITKKIPLDSIVVKVGMADALMPMNKETYEALPKVNDFVKNAVSRAPKRGKVLIIGVGNSCGIGNNKHEIKDLKKVVNRLDKKRKQEETAKRKGGWF